MAEASVSKQPRVLFLSFEGTLREMICEFLQFGGYTVLVTHTANDTLEIVEREGGTYVVLMDNYHVSPNAHHFSQMVFARPNLHRRVKVVGLAAGRMDEDIDLDAHVNLPFTVDELLDAITRLSAGPQARH